MGGKLRLVPHLLPMIPEHTCYVEVFGGGAALLLNKPRSPLEAYNDVDGELVNLFEVVRDDVDIFLRRADLLLYSRELFERWKQDLKNGNMPRDRVERAVRFWYLIRSSFAGKVGHGWGFNRTAPRGLAHSIFSALADIRRVHERLKGVEIDHLDFRRCIDYRDAPSSFLYVDPPYLGTEDYRLGKFTLQDHRDLAGLLRNAESKWLLTVGDRPELRGLYRGFPRRAVRVMISSEKVIGGKRKPLTNLIIWNYELPAHGN